MRGLFEFDYNSVDTETMDKASGLTTQTDSSTWGQKYNLGLEKSLFPNLRLSAGGIFEKSDMDTTIDGVDLESQRTNTRPYADLTLDNRLYRAGLGYSKREAEQQATGSLERTDVNELTSAIFGWKPDGLPTLDLRIDKNDLYDKSRQYEDSTTTTSSLTSRYRTEKFDIQYYPVLQDYTNRIENYELQNATHNGRVAYSDTFFNKRTNFGATYNITDRHQKTIAHGVGELAEQITQINQGLFLESDSPSTAALASLPQLIDGQFNAIASVNLGTSASVVRKNLGLDFGVDTEVNGLRVFVDKELPTSLSDFFTWEIYTSDDNSSWQFERTVTLASFNAFQNYFEIDFPALTARHIKVVVRPLRVTSVPPDSADPQYASINVTELQAFVRTVLPDGESKTSSTFHMLNMDARTRLMEQFDLFHDVSLFLTKADPGAGERTTVSNILSANRRFTPILSGNARVLREDINELHASGFAHGYSAALRADPFKTLNNTLVASGRQEEVGDDDTTKNSLFLQNRAELYRGIDVFLDGGLSWQSQGTGEDQESRIVNFGSNMVPHRTMTITGSYSQTSTDYSGGVAPDVTRRDSRMDVGVAWRPFQTVYLVASYGFVEQERRNDTLKNYSLGWSPFPYGTLQLQFDYSEELRSEDESKVTTLRPGIRWEIAPKINLMVSYFRTESDSVFQTVDMEALSANLKIMY